MESSTTEEVFTVYESRRGHQELVSIKDEVQDKEAGYEVEVAYRDGMNYVIVPEDHSEGFEDDYLPDHFQTELKADKSDLRSWLGINHQELAGLSGELLEDSGEMSSASQRRAATD